MLVHRFQRPAPAAERILAALEEEGWPPRIDDPLLPRAGVEEPRRLRRELAALNRRWKRPLLRFYMDGTGQGLCWKLCFPVSQAPWA